jgi:hypothetical protein
VSTKLATLNLACMEQAHQAGTRHVQLIRSLLSRQLGMRRHHRNTMATGHVRQDARRQLNRNPWQHELITAVIDEPNRRGTIGMRMQVSLHPPKRLGSNGRRLRVRQRRTDRYGHNHTQQSRSHELSIWTGRISAQQRPLPWWHC